MTCRPSMTICGQLSGLLHGESDAIAKAAVFAIDHSEGGALCKKIGQRRRTSDTRAREDAGVFFPAAMIRSEAGRFIPGLALFRTPYWSMLQISIFDVELCFWRETRLRRYSPLKIDRNRLSCTLRGKQFSMDD